MTRPKFTHDLAAGGGGPPDWVHRDDTQLVIRTSNGRTERWNYYLERGEDGQMWPALPPAARNEENSISEQKTTDAGN